jgi:CRP-like cAMP-binding protein
MILDKLSATFSLFKSMSDEDLKALLDFCETKQIPKGGTLWHEGDSDNYAAFILSGQIGIKKKTEFKGKHVMVGTFSRGSVVGELCLLTDNIRSVTAEVLEPVEVVILTSENFEKLLAKHTHLGLTIMKSLFVTAAKRLRSSTQRLASMF